MKIAVTCSSKEGLLQEYRRHFQSAQYDAIPPDFFAEGDSDETLEAIAEALRSHGHHVTRIEADDTATDRLLALQPDLVFNIAEGLFGDFRESYIPMLCERLGIPYTGSDPLTLGICLNKVRCKEVLSFNRIANPEFRVFQPDQAIVLEGFSFPAIVKPVAEGSSKGIFDDSVVEDRANAIRLIAEKMKIYHQPVLLEQFLAGDEFTVAMWGNRPHVRVLPVVAMRYDTLPAGAKPIYSYEAKWIWDTREKPLDIFQCPAKISESLRLSIEETVLGAYHVLGIRDWCRIDVRLDKQGVPHILELNPLPGILPNPEDNSCFPKAARTAGFAYADMLNQVVQIAAERYHLEMK